MKNKGQSSLWFSLAICFCSLIIGGFAQSVETKLWFRDPSMDGVIVNLDSMPVSQYQDVLPATSKLLCAATCLQRPWCHSFFFKPSALCRLHAETFDTTADTEAFEGVRYFRDEQAPCPTANGYSRETHSGLCYKVFTTPLDSLASRSFCAAEGGYLVQLDTLPKLRGLLAALMQVPAYIYQWFHVGASRPSTEWDQPWTLSSPFFVWERSGQSMSSQMDFFNPGQPDRNANENCVDMVPSSGYYTNFTYFTTFADGLCAFECSFICEI